MGENALQYSVGFCRATPQIIHSYTSITSLLNLPPLPHSTLLGQVTGRLAGLPVFMQQLLISCLFTHGSVW